MKSKQRRERRPIGAAPGRSTRQAAADLGMSDKTVRKARSSGADQSAPATVAGKDGKSYRALVCAGRDFKLQKKRCNAGFRGGPPAATQV
jgi:hypothetical protein